VASPCQLLSSLPSSWCILERDPALEEGQRILSSLIQGRLGVGIAKGPFCLCGALRVLGGDLNPIRLGLHSSPGWGVSSCLFLSSASLKLAPVVLLVLVPRKGVPLATWSCSTLSRHPRDCGGFHVDYLIQTGWMGQGRGIWS
jgi:hypothetical protein